MTKCSLLKIQKLFSSQLHFNKCLLFELTNQWDCLQSELCFPSFTQNPPCFICLSLHTLLEHPSYRQFFLVLTEVHWFSHSYNLDLMCFSFRETQVERVSPKSYSSFIMPEEKGKHKVCFCQVGTGCWQRQCSAANKAFHFQ